MAQLPDTRFCEAHGILRDGSVPLTCSGDQQAWPWLVLDPHHPIVVQTVNFWASVEAGLLKGNWEEGQWTALTEMEWECGAPGCGHAHHGLADYFDQGSKQHFRLTLFDANGHLVYRVSGAGVVFRNRDFEGWRDASKQAAADLVAEDFTFAPDDRVQAPCPGGSVLAALASPDARTAQGLVTAENGLPPGNPYMSGSGDHVNATHLAEAVRQFAALTGGAKQPYPRAGSARFTHYVELGVPFEVSGDGRETQVHQNGKLCAIFADYSA